MRRTGRFAPPLALMAVIFALSAQPDLNSGLGTIDLIGRKVVHATEYGVLFLLWLRALDRVPAVRYRRAGPQLFAAVIAIAYAATDEVHQTFVDGRHGTPIDVLIDTTGVAIALVITRRIQAHRAGRLGLVTQTDLADG